MKNLGWVTLNEQGWVYYGERQKSVGVKLEFRSWVERLLAPSFAAYIGAATRVIHIIAIKIFTNVLIVILSFSSFNINV